MCVQSSAHPVASVLGVVVHDNHVLLVRRINPPDAGKWGYPGGWIDPGETMAHADVKLFEETAVRIEARSVFNALEASVHMAWSTTASLRATATSARLRPFLRASRAPKLRRDEG